MTANRLTVPAVAALLLAGCATLAPETSQNATTLRCDEAVGQGLSAGAGYARAIAESGVRYQVGDVRGYLLSAGLHRVRPAGKTVTCKPYLLGGGLTQCTVVARFCGR